MRGINMTGVKYGKLTVLDNFVMLGRQRKWECLCECGKTSFVSGHHLRGGATKSCGCLSKHPGHIKHEMSGSITYNSWTKMRVRCLSKKSRKYSRYGGRGIKICDQWLSTFDNFLADMGERPSFEYSIDRIDNDGNYEPGNCRWATRSQQQRNKGISANNKTGVNGVSFNQKSQLYVAGITANSKFISLGAYGSVEDAAKARADGELKYWS